MKRFLLVDSTLLRFAQCGGGYEPWRQTLHQDKVTKDSTLRHRRNCTLEWNPRPAWLSAFLHTHKDVCTVNFYSVFMSHCTSWYCDNTVSGVQALSSDMDLYKATSREEVGGVGGSLFTIKGLHPASTNGCFSSPILHLSTSQ